MAYVLAHFLHVLGALGMAAAYGVEAAGLVGLRVATTADEARASLQTRRWVLLLGATSTVLLLSTGVYATVVAWGLAAWIVVSLASVLAIAVIGGVLTGVPMARLGPAIQGASGALPEDLRRAIRSRVLTSSISLRTSITLGVVFLMVRKPDAVTSVLVLGVAAAVGLGAGLGLVPRESRRAPARAARP
jgi:hypothetical protein